jgi:hypothetical protein
MLPPIDAALTLRHGHLPCRRFRRLRYAMRRDAAMLIFAAIIFAAVYAAQPDALRQRAPCAQRAYMARGAAFKRTRYARRYAMSRVAYAAAVLPRHGATRIHDAASAAATFSSAISSFARFSPFISPLITPLKMPPLFTCLADCRLPMLRHYATAAS